MYFVCITYAQVPPKFFKLERLSYSQWAPKLESRVSSFNPYSCPQNSEFENSPKLFFGNVSKRLPQFFTNLVLFFVASCSKNQNFWNHPNIALHHFPALNIKLCKIAKNDFFRFWYRSLYGVLLFCVDLDLLEAFRIWPLLDSKGRNFKSHFLNDSSKGIGSLNFVFIGPVILAVHWNTIMSGLLVIYIDRK